MAYHDAAEHGSPPIISINFGTAPTHGDSTERVRRFRERKRRGDRMVSFRLTANEQQELARLGYVESDDFNTAAEACLSDYLVEAIGARKRLTGT